VILEVHLRLWRLIYDYAGAFLVLYSIFQLYFVQQGTGDSAGVNRDRDEGRNSENGKEDDKDDKTDSLMKELEQNVDIGPAEAPLFVVIIAGLLVLLIPTMVFCYCLKCCRSLGRGAVTDLGRTTGKKNVKKTVKKTGGFAKSKNNRNNNNNVNSLNRNNNNNTTNLNNSNDSLRTWVATRTQNWQSRFHPDDFEPSVDEIRRQNAQRGAQQAGPGLYPGFSTSTIRTDVSGGNGNRGNNAGNNINAATRTAHDPATANANNTPNPVFSEQAFQHAGLYNNQAFQGYSKFQEKRNDSK
jgi:hypothetical protein